MLTIAFNANDVKDMKEQSTFELPKRREMKVVPALTYGRGGVFTTPRFLIQVPVPLDGYGRGCRFEKRTN